MSKGINIPDPRRRKCIEMAEFEELLDVTTGPTNIESTANLTAEKAGESGASRPRRSFSESHVAASAHELPLFTPSYTRCMHICSRNVSTMRITV